MLNSKDLFRDLRKQITLPEDDAELNSIVYLLLEDIVAISRSDVMAQKDILITSDQFSLLNKAVERINRGEPVQYISGKAHFYGREFQMNTFVLIPRPETELLIVEAIKHANALPGKILDIGTGSGCIAITLAKERPLKKIVAYDVSDAALKVAAANAKKLSVTVDFEKLDILNEPIVEQDLEMIVSNPPYVTLSERTSMKRNVLEHEPHLALFVPDNDPLIFYKIIAKKGLPALKRGGIIIVEINERFGKEVCNIFTQAGFKNATVIRDLQHKDRIVFAIK